MSVFRKRVGACQDLVSIALLTRCNVQVLRICPPSANGKRKVVAEYHAVPIFRDPSGWWVDHLFRFPDIAAQAREVFTAWFENAERLSAVRSLYLSAAYGKNFLEIKLLALAQAAEALIGGSPKAKTVTRSSPRTSVTSSRQWRKGSRLS